MLRNLFSLFLSLFLYRFSCLPVQFVVSSVWASLNKTMEWNRMDFSCMSCLRDFTFLNIACGMLLLHFENLTFGIIISCSGRVRSGHTKMDPWTSLYQIRSWICYRNCGITAVDSNFVDLHSPSLPGAPARWAVTWFQGDNV